MGRSIFQSSFQHIFMFTTCINDRVHLQFMNLMMIGPKAGLVIFRFGMCYYTAILYIKLCLKLNFRKYSYDFMCICVCVCITFFLNLNLNWKLFYFSFYSIIHLYNDRVGLFLQPHCCRPNMLSLPTTSFHFFYYYY